MLMLLAALPLLQGSTATTSYSESLNVYIAGSNAYWYFTFSGVNGSSKLSAFESSPGLSWYNVTAIMTTGWKSDFQVFGPLGYNLLPVPFIPSQGLFLTLGSDSYPDALAAAGRLNSYLLSTFVSYSNDSGYYEFYSPLTFTEVIPVTLLKLIPSTMGGFAAAVTSSGLDQTSSPLVMLEGTKGASGFSHSLVVGSISSEALNSNSKPNILSYFGSTVTSLKAANDSVSSTVKIHALDGIMSLTSKDNATLVNVTSHYSSVYSLSLAPQAKLFQVNATVLQQPQQLLAERQVDVGVLQPGENMTVTITLTDVSSVTSLESIAYSDNWWNPALFKLVGGTGSVFSQALLNASGTATPYYKLEYIGNITSRITIPPVAVSFAYLVGGSTFKGQAWLNPITISLGEDNPVVLAYAAPAVNFSQPLGATQTLHLFVKNVGTRTATDVVVDGATIPGGALTADGGSYTATIPIVATGLLNTNVTSSYFVTYENPQGETFNATTNRLSLIFAHSGMLLGYPEVVVGAIIKPLRQGSTATNLTLTFTVTNAGNSSLLDFVSKGQIPSGLGCGVTNGTGISCPSGTDLLKLNYTVLASRSTHETTMKFNVTSPENFFISPLTFGGVSAGISLMGSSNAIAVPTGLVLTKAFSPSLLFAGVTSSVKLLADNAGPFTIYNVTVSSTVDSFDKLSPLAIPTISNSSIIAKGNLTRSYPVNATTSYGNHTSSEVSSTLYFGGTQYSIESLGPYVAVYEPLNATVTTTPLTPTEGKDFKFYLTISNPASVNVTSVVLTLPIPSGLTLSQMNNNASVSHGVLMVNIRSLLSHSSFKVTAEGIASNGATYSWKGASLTFVYGDTTIKGFVPGKGIVVNEDVTTRYLIPLAVAVIVLLAAAFYVRRLAAPSVPASPK